MVWNGVKSCFHEVENFYQQAWLLVPVIGFRPKPLSRYSRSSWVSSYLFLIFDSALVTFKELNAPLHCSLNKSWHSLIQLSIHLFLYPTNIYPVHTVAMNKTVLMPDFNVLIFLTLFFFQIQCPNYLWAWVFSLLLRPVQISSLFDVLSGSFTVNVRLWISTKSQPQSCISLSFTPTTSVFSSPCLSANDLISYITEEREARRE